MIKIKIIDGSCVNEEKEVPEGIEPNEFFDWALGRNVLWEINWSLATDSERLEWGLADLVSRVVRALASGRVVHFLGKVYQASPETFTDVVGAVEDAIVESGYNVCIVLDDDTGVIIGTAGSEYLLQ